MDALNATTFASFNQTKDYFVVLEEVSKYNVQLNIVEKLWAACSSTSAAVFPT
ncbi:putative C-4 methyl sterol oxidase [Fusarium fujikuroi]|nr:putative C-4 methyl sterol oxidase [Fusarium fujikuroi]